MVIDLSSEAREYFKHSTLREIDLCGEGIFSTPHLFKVLYRKDIVKSPVSLRDSPDCVQLLELFLVNLFFFLDLNTSFSSIIFGVLPDAEQKSLANLKDRVRSKMRTVTKFMSPPSSEWRFSTPPHTLGSLMPNKQ